MIDVYLNNDHTLTVSGLEAIDGTLLDMADIEFQIYDSDETAVAGASGTLEQSGTSNDYAGEVDKVVVNLLTSGQEYTIRIVGSQGGYEFEFVLPIRVGRRLIAGC